MKKTLRLFTAVIFTVFMVMSMSVTAFEADEYSITMKRVANDTAAHTYEAYQIFSVSKITGTGDNTAVSGVEWGDGVDDTALLAALKADTTVIDTVNNVTLGSLFDSCTTAAGTAKVLDENKGNVEFVKRFSELVNANLGTAAATGNMAAADSSVKLDVTTKGKGYYFVKDKDATQQSKSGAYTKYVLRVLGQEEIKAKAVVPTLDKKIVESGSEVSANTASIGDTVTFRINTAVPDTSAYNKYYFIINDTLCNGLTFDQTSVKVYANGSASALGSDAYTIKTGADAGDYTFQIVLKNAKSYSGQDIKVEYNAVLNQNADLTSTGNPNTASLTFSNDPNHEYKGDNEPSETPSDGDVTGKTPDIQTKTFTTGIKLTKKDGESGTPLAGAKFKIEGDGVNAVIINRAIYKKDNTNGTYYMLKDGTFTDTAATTATRDKYDSTTDKYVLVNTVDKDTQVASLNNIAYSKSDGIVSFVGLAAGDYTITELEAPEGYNKLASAITIKVEAQLDQTAKTCTWTVTKGTETLTAGTDNLYAFEVENNQGIVLPGTGGMGTTVFYVVGGLLTLCAGALLVTKIRTSQKNK